MVYDGTGELTKISLPITVLPEQDNLTFHQLENTAGSETLVIADSAGTYSVLTVHEDSLLNLTFTATDPDSITSVIISNHANHGNSNITCELDSTSGDDAIIHFSYLPSYNYHGDDEVQLQITDKQNSNYLITLPLAL